MLKEAGEELDILIADKIFGVQPTQPGNEGLCIFWKSGNCVFFGRCNFSGHILAAWGVVETLMEQGYYLYLECDSSGGGLWEARFGGQAAASVTAETAPLAICLAALKVIGRKDRGL